MITGVVLGVPPPSITTRTKSGATVQVFTFKMQGKIPAVTFKTLNRDSTG